jgi:hypothetical protein
MQLPLGQSALVEQSPGPPPAPTSFEAAFGPVMLPLLAPAPPAPPLPIVSTSLPQAPALTIVAANTAHRAKAI